MKTLRYHILICSFVLAVVVPRAQTPLLNSYSPAQPTVYLVFDGAEVDGTIWNEQGKILADPAGLSPSTITWIHHLIAEHFTLFNLNVTTDPAVYLRAPVQQRVKVIFTPSGTWYGNVSGVSAIGSFVWGDDTPAWVFTGMLSNDPSFIANAAVHQIGHTLGLQHQSLYDSYGIMITELSGGETNIFSSQAPLMGIPFYKKAGWTNGHPSTGPQYVQNDTAAIAGAPNAIGYRKVITEEKQDDNAIFIERNRPGNVQPISMGNFNFRLIDMSGRILTQGELRTGFNEIHVHNGSTGVLVLQWSDGNRSGSQKLMGL